MGKYKNKRDKLSEIILRDEVNSMDNETAIKGNERKADYTLGVSEEGLARVYFLTPGASNYINGRYHISPAALSDGDFDVLERRKGIEILDIEVASEDEERKVRYDAAVVYRRGEDIIGLLKEEDSEGYLDPKTLQKHGMISLNRPVEEIPLSNLDEGVRIYVPFTDLMPGAGDEFTAAKGVRADGKNAFYSLYRDNPDYVGEGFLGSVHGIEHLISQMEDARYI